MRSWRRKELWKRTEYQVTRIDKQVQSITDNKFLDESYDRLDFTRPIQDLKPHYQSTDTIRSRSRNSSHLSKEGQDEISNNSFESNKSETDFCKEVLTSVENLNASTTRTRKTIYEPEVDSGISSNRSTTTNPWSPVTERSGIMWPWCSTWYSLNLSET